jgi:cobalamin biosynthesis protein CbiM
MAEYRHISRMVVDVHVPDGFIDAPVSLAAGAVAVAGVAVSLRGARRELDDRTAPLAGLTAAFVFAAQMLNFPVASGTSGHLLGGALAAILVGPYAGVLCVSVVLLLQALLFADGGLTALGVNVTLMALVTVPVGYGLFRLLLRALPKSRTTAGAAAFLAALVSVPASALAFTLIYAVGGTTEVPIGTVATAMLGVHLLIGIGEGVITGFAVSSVLAVRPDLVYGARDMIKPVELRTAPRPATATTGEDVR